MNNPTQEPSTKPWFIISIGITLLLLALLAGGLLFSFNVLDSFIKEEMEIERSSWKLLLFSEKMSMATRVSALSGNLKWKEQYVVAQPKLEKVLQEIPEYFDSSALREKSENLHRYYQNIKRIEAKVFKLVSRGEKEAALRLLSGWDYTKNRLAFEESTRELVEVIQQRIQRRNDFQKNVSVGILIVVLIATVFLVMSWTVAIKLWRRQIQARQQAEENLRESEEKYRKLINTSPDSIAFVDKEGRIVTSNPAMATRFSKAPHELEGAKLETMMGRETAELHLQHGLEALKTGEVKIFQDKNEGRIYENYYVPVYTLRGRDSFQIISKEITEQKNMEERLKNISIYDSLTKLYSRIFFEEEMQRLEDGRYTPLSIIICDVDGLKLINDAIGHNEGDTMLLAAADILKSSFRSSDVVARIGGDEFVVLLPNSDREVVDAARERIQKKIEQYNRDEKGFPLSVSIGYAVTESPPVDMNDLFKMADDAMYEEKLQNRPQSRRRLVETITERMDARDDAGSEHIKRIQEYSQKLGKALGFDEERLATLKTLGKYHDLGKVGIPEHILFKDGPLTEEEKEVLKSHCVIGHRIAMSIPEISHLGEFILRHHEWWDGRGYPGGLQGEEIPLESRILAISDAYEALTSERWGHVSVSGGLEELRRCAGSKFDPELLEKFVEIVKEEGETEA